MKRINKYLIIPLLTSLLFISCQKEKSYTYQIGNPKIELKTDVSSALFGDSLQFQVIVSDSEIALSTLKAELYFTDDKVSETIIRTKEAGEYSGKLYIPFLKNIPNGTATLKFVLENISQKKAIQEFDINLSRPDFPYINLITADRTYKLLKTQGNNYALTENLPFSIKGYLEAPKVGLNGNILQFGWVNNTIALGSTADIPFSNSTSGTYTISFNTLTYEAEPFIIAYSINGTVLTRINNDLFKAEINLNKGQEINIEGIEDINDWWIDSDFLNKDDNGNITSNVINGKYRITADFAKKYFIIETMDNNDLAKLKADGTGAIWIIGDGIGKPSVFSNHVSWNTSKALCMAPTDNKKYQVTITGAKTVYTDYINFKFFHQKDWGKEFGSSTLTTNSDLIFIGNGTNGRDNGNLGLISGKTIEDNKTYLLTVDLSEGVDNAKLVVTEK